MRAVVDSSVLVASLVTVEREAQWARSIVAGHQMAAPEHALVEASNVLRRMELAGTISRLEATSDFNTLSRMKLELFPFAPFAKRVWELRGNLTCYDAWFVALAEGLGCPLFTLDARLARARGPSCEIITPPSAAPELPVHQFTTGSNAK